MKAMRTDDLQRALSGACGHVTAVRRCRFAPSLLFASGTLAALPACTFDPGISLGEAFSWAGCYSSGPTGLVRLELAGPGPLDSDLLAGTLEIGQDGTYSLNGTAIDSTLAILDGRLAGRPDLTGGIVLLRSVENTVTVRIDEVQFLGPLVRPCP
jgi:hypothetical protein